VLRNRREEQFVSSWVSEPAATAAGNVGLEMRLRTLWVPLLVLLLVVPTVRSAVAANPANGERIAMRWCSSCHAVGPAQPSATEAPPFSSIARKHRLDGRWIAFFLLNPHPQMPDFGLTRDAASDLAAYILKQR
jgi:mono/diheme cytochrome c family protein